MSDTPDFDSMSPEEMMAWMESLAKRQGAVEGFTTEADIEVDEISEDDERLQGLPEYKPYGMSDEKWAELQAKEQAQKAARASQTAPAAPVSAGTDDVDEVTDDEETIPMTAAVGLPMNPDGTPDVESMTPEQLQEWMESLAKRQGGDSSGFLTQASMEVTEVDADDERLQGTGEYKPYGMSDEKWAELKAKEEAEKAARLAAQKSQPVIMDDDEDDDYDDYEYDDEDDEDEQILVRSSLDDIFGDTDGIQLPELDYDDEDEQLMLEDDDELAAIDFDEEANVIDLDALDLDDEDDDDYAYEDDEDEEEAVASPMSWLEGLASGDSDDDGIDLSALSDDNEIPDLESLDFGQEEEAGVNPMAWLEGLAGDTADESPDVDLTTAGDLDFDLDALTAEGDEELDDVSNPIEWIESLARDQGADLEELTTDASLQIERPADLGDDAPGYEPYSFEQGGDLPSETRPPQATPPQRKSLEPADLSDPSAWLDKLASNSGLDDESDEDFSEMDEEFAEAQRRGELTPEQVEQYFMKAFERADKRDIPDYIEEDIVDEVDADDSVIEPSIPDWLQESMETIPPIEAEDEEEEIDEAMLANLFSSEAAEELDMLEEASAIGGDDVPEMPDWLKEDALEDAGDISDIFADIESETAATVDEPEIDTGELVLDVESTDDPWIEAFASEDSPQIQAWYEQKVKEFETGELDESKVAPAASLSPAELGDDVNLPMGQLQSVPDWLAQGAETPELAVASVPDWIESDEEIAEETGMPDWLREQVDDTVTDPSELPDWIRDENLDIDAEQIPPWLLESVADDEDSYETIVLPDTSELTAPPELAELEAQHAQPAPTAPVPVASSPAPIMKKDAQIDVAAALKSARDNATSGDITGALSNYEAVVRSNQALDQVTADLRKLTETEALKKNPAVHRVLGDSLMRQGSLQEALDVYRRALNML